MKKLLFLIVILLSIQTVYAHSMNKALYQQTMNANAYRRNYYNAQRQNRAVPYWQAQSNFSTRNRMYQNYSSYTNHVNEYNSSSTQLRGYR